VRLIEKKLNKNPARLFKNTVVAVSCSRVACGVILMCAVSMASDDEKTVNITSEPPGAHVIINGRDQGVTPLEIKVGHWAFDTKKSTAFSKHLQERWELRISKDG
jgi:PEGA domain